MYPNLLGQKAFKRLSNDDMGKIAGLSRNSYEQKMKCGRFTPQECKRFCLYFGKSFEFLFATNDEVDKTA